MDELTQLAELLRAKNAIDRLISARIGRAAGQGHVGEWIAARIFDIALHKGASHKASDGIFRAGPRADRTVNIRWYAKQEAILDLPKDGAADGLPDDYLVLTGPRPQAGIPHRPWLITAAYLFDAAQLIAELQTQKKKIGIATGINKAQWEAAELYPAQRTTLLTLTAEQRARLQLFAQG